MNIAHWRINDDGDEINLQIELGNDYAVTLTCRKDEPQVVALWHGSGEQTFNDIEWDGFRMPGRTVDAFRAWLQAAEKAGEMR